MQAYLSEIESLAVNQGIVIEDVFEAFRAQLQKDLDLSGQTTDFSTCNDLETLWSEFQYLIEELMRTNSESVAGLLYRVDVSESLIQRYGMQYPQDQWGQSVAKAILIREFEKVLYRFGNRF